MAEEDNQYLEARRKSDLIQSQNRGIQIGVKNIMRLLETAPREWEGNGVWWKHKIFAMMRTEALTGKPFEEKKQGEIENEKPATETSG